MGCPMIVVVFGFDTTMGKFQIKTFFEELMFRDDPLANCRRKGKL